MWTRLWLWTRTIDDDDVLKSRRRRLEGIDGLFLLQDVKDFQAMMQPRDLRELEQVEHAAKRGKLQWLIYLHEKGCPWDSWACKGAAEGGHLTCLQYLHKKRCPWNEGSCQGAAERGHLACLQYLHDNGCPWNSWAFSGAAEGGHLDCLQYLNEKGCPRPSRACRGAAQGGHLACLQYLHKNEISCVACGWVLDDGVSEDELSAHVEFISLWR